MVVPLSTKDGTSNKNARLTNCLKESRERKDATVWVRGVKQPAPPIDKAVIRPGLVLEAEGTGVGGGLVAFDNDLVSVYGTTLGFLTEGTGVWTGPDATTYDALGDPYSLVSHPAWDGTKWLARIFNTATSEFVINDSTDGITFNYLAAYPGSNLAAAKGLQSFFGNWYVQDNTGAMTTVWMSSNSGASWSALSVLPFFASGQLVFFYALDGDLYATNTTSGDTAKSTDQGATWGAAYSNPLIYGAEFQSQLWYWDTVGNTVSKFTDVSGTSAPVSSPFDGDSAYVWIGSDGVALYLYNTTRGLYTSNGSAFTLLGDPGYAMTLIYYPEVVGGDVYFYEAAQTTTYTPAAATIPALATIATGLYDFAQSST